MKNNMDPTDHELLLKSLDFIEMNPNISTDQIPDLFLDYWAIPDFTVSQECKISESQLLIFMYILKQHYCTQDELDNVLNWFYLYQLFYSFQIVLAVTKYCRKNDIPLTPFAIFDIRQYTVSRPLNPDEMIELYQRVTGHVSF